MFAVGRELDVISQADTLEAFRAVREDLVLTTHAYYLAEMVDLLTEDHMENRAVFDALVDGLRDLGDTADARLVLIIFHLRLLEALGYRPELRECVSCRATIEPDAQPVLGVDWAACCAPPAGRAKSTARAHRHARPRSCCASCSTPTVGSRWSCRRRSRARPKRCCATTPSTSSNAACAARR